MLWKNKLELAGSLGREQSLCKGTEYSDAHRRLTVVGYRVYVGGLEVGIKENRDSMGMRLVIKADTGSERTYIPC